MSRYSVTLTADHRAYVIMDHYLEGYCTLPDDGDPSSRLPLEWSNYGAAEAWLYRCRRLWSRGLVPAPKGWNETHQGPTTCPRCSRPVDNIIEMHIPGASGPGYTHKCCPHCQHEVRQEVLKPLQDTYNRIMNRRFGFN